MSRARGLTWSVTNRQAQMCLAAGGNGRAHKAHQNEQIGGHLIRDCHRVLKRKTGDYIGKNQYCHNGNADAGNEFLNFLKHTRPSLVDPESGAGILAVISL